MVLVVLAAAAVVVVTTAKVTTAAGAVETGLLMLVGIPDRRAVLLAVMVGQVLDRPVRREQVRLVSAVLVVLRGVLVLRARKAIMSMAIVM